MPSWTWEENFGYLLGTLHILYSIANEICSGSRDANPTEEPSGHLQEGFWSQGRLVCDFLAPQKISQMWLESTSSHVGGGPLRPSVYGLSLHQYSNKEKIPLCPVRSLNIYVLITPFLYVQEDVYLRCYMSDFDRETKSNLCVFFFLSQVSY